MFKSQKSANAWAKQRLARNTNNVDFLVDHLKEDLVAVKEAQKSFEKKKKPIPTELLRQKQGIMTSLRTLISGDQSMLLALIAKRNLLTDINGEDEKGGDVVFEVAPLPPVDDGPTA